MAGAIAPAKAPRCLLSSRGPKPPASARPAPGGRFPPAGSGAGLRCSRTCRSAGHRPVRAGETRVAFPDPARTDESTVTAAMAGAIAPAIAPRRDQDQPGAKAPGQRPPRHRRALRPRRVGRWPFVVPGLVGLLGTVPRGRGNALRFLFPPGEVKALSPLQWQGPSPLPQRHAAPCPAGGQSPRPAPAPPLAGALHPPGRALASVARVAPVLCGSVPRGRGKRGAFPDPAHIDESTVTASMAGAIAPATALRWHQDQPRATAPGQRPPRPRRALCTRRVGRWPFVVPGLVGLLGTVPRGRGNALRFLFPPALTKALPPPQWQGPSPRPRRYAGIRTSRGPQPPASARPAPGGRFAPAVSGAGLRSSRTCRSAGRRHARAGKTRVAFPAPARSRSRKASHQPRRDSHQPPLQ